MGEVLGCAKIARPMHNRRFLWLGPATSRGAFFATSRRSQMTLDQWALILVFAFVGILFAAVLLFVPA